MKLKVVDLIGEQLDWAVEFADGSEVYRRLDFIRKRAAFTGYDKTNPEGLAFNLENQSDDLIVGDLKTGHTRFVKKFSSDASEAYPIILEHKIQTLHFTHKRSQNVLIEQWEAYVGGQTYFIEQRMGDGVVGATPLIAAMRAYVLLKLGEEIDIPDTLKLNAEIGCKTNKKNGKQ